MLTDPVAPVAVPLPIVTVPELPMLDVPVVSWTDPLGALSWFLPFDCSADILPCALSSCVCYTLIGLIVLVFVVSLLTELPKVLIHRVFGE